MPIVSFPSGGLAEQVINGKTGVLARQMTKRAFADAIRELAVDRVCYSRISQYLRETAADRSMRTFIARILEQIEH
jgi:glycosyltransferase involved in cell wall biosynthesis